MSHVIQMRGTEGKGVRAIARDCERLKALGKHSTPTSRRGSTK